MYRLDIQDGSGYVNRDYTTCHCLYLFSYQQRSSARKYTVCCSPELVNYLLQMKWYVFCIYCIARYYCIYSSHVITPLVNSSLYSCVTYRQVKEMVTLNLFIESHYKYIVLSIRERHILTLHLSTANCRILTTTGCCCKNVAATQCSCYAIYFCLVESIPQFLKLWPMPMHV